jgi:hypothetical protein
MCFILTKFEQQDKKKAMKKKKQTNKQTWTLAYTLVLQIMSFPVSSFSWSGSIDFPSKMIPCKLNHNLICFGLGVLLKSLETGSKLLTNRNAQFHWTLLLEPLFNVALKLIFYKYGNTTLKMSKWDMKIYEFKCKNVLPNDFEIETLTTNYCKSKLDKSKTSKHELCCYKLIWLPPK